MCGFGSGHTITTSASSESCDKEKLKDNETNIWTFSLNGLLYRSRRQTENALERIGWGREEWGIGNRILDQGPFAAYKFQLQPHRLDGQEEVCKDYGRVYVQDFNGLKRHSRG